VEGPPRPFHGAPAASFERALARPHSLLTPITKES
jgi:hypothetical protein